MFKEKEQGERENGERNVGAFRETPLQIFMQ